LTIANRLLWSVTATGRHALRRGLVDEIVDAHHAVDQRVLGMQAEVDEGVHRKRDLTGA
jgi:ClpP class serine protease